MLRINKLSKSARKEMICEKQRKEVTEKRMQMDEEKG